MDEERVVELHLGVTPEAAISGAVLVQTERSTFLTFNAMKKTNRLSPSGRYYRENAGTAVVEFTFCTVTKFGYPNDEAWDSIPRTKGLSYGIFEVENSEWKLQLSQLNRHSFPNTKEWSGRHFLFLFHDSSFECIAKDMNLDIMTEPYAEVFQKITNRIISE
jgi:hypothetical protein